MDLNEIKLPYVIKDVVLFSPGNHNGLEYTPQAIQFAFQNTDWNERTTSLYLDHEDEFAEDPRTGEKVLVRGASVRNWAGEVKNQRFANGDIRGDLYILDRDTAVKLAYGAHFGISPRGKARREGRFSNKTSEVLVENYSIVVNPAIKTAYINDENGFLTPLDDNVVYYSMMAEDYNVPWSTEKLTMDAEQLKEELTKAMKETVMASMADMNAKVTKLGEDVAKMKKVPEEEELKKDEKKAPLKEEPKKEEEKKEEMKCKKPVEEDPEEDDEEEMKEMMSSITPENLASWQELVRKYGIKGAKAKMGKKDDAEKDAKMAELEAKVKELTEKVNKPAERKSASTETVDGPSIQEMSQRELDIRFIGYLQEMNGIPNTSEQKLKEEGFSA